MYRFLSGYEIGRGDREGVENREETNQWNIAGFSIDIQEQKTFMKEEGIGEEHKKETMMKRKYFLRKGLCPTILNYRGLRLLAHKYNYRTYEIVISRVRGIYAIYCTEA